MSEQNATPDFIGDLASAIQAGGVEAAASGAATVNPPAVSDGLPDRLEALNVRNAPKIQDTGDAELAPPDNSKDYVFSEDGVYQRPDFLPEKFWGDGPSDPNDPASQIEHLKSVVGRLAKSYNGAEDVIRQGAHKKAPDEYDATAFKGVIGDDDPVMKAYKDVAKENGLSQKQFNSLAKTVIEASEAYAKEIGATDLSQYEYKSIQKELGDNHEAIVGYINSQVDQMVDNGVVDRRDADYLNLRAGRDPHSIRALYNILRRNGTAQIDARAGAPVVKSASEKMEEASRTNNTDAMIDILAAEISKGLNR